METARDTILEQWQLAKDELTKETMKKESAEKRIAILCRKCAELKQAANFLEENVMVGE